MGGDPVFWPMFHPFGRDASQVQARFLASLPDVEGHGGENLTYRLVAAQEVILAELGFPYFKVWPDYVELFRKTNLSAMPLSAIRFPFESWSLLPPQGLLKYAGNEVTAIKLLYCSAMRVINASGGLDDSGLAAKKAYEAGGYDADNAARLMMTIEVRHEDGYRDQRIASISVDQYLRNNPQVDVETVVRELCERPAPGLLPGEDFATTADLWRIAISTAFVATGQYDFISPDVLNKDLAKFLTAVQSNDQAAIERLGEKAASRRGERGFVVGKFREIVHPSMQVVKGAEADGTGRELTHQHLRSGHFHTYWVGPGRQQREIKFVLQTVVRADLPPAPAATPRVIK